ncbi:MAG: helix-turn-helix domain-containing protein [Sphingobacteriia bacterium]|nr:helix-turn-helix domain-containing protein [Sphingobacteriia bacterium]
MSVTCISQNIRNLRRREGWTQEELAQRMGIKRSLLGAYEEGRAEPRAELLLKFANLFGISLEQLITLPIDTRNFTPGAPTDLQGRKLRVLSILVNENQEELIPLVPARAAAGYLNGYADPEYIEKLPGFHLPNFPQGTFRAFEILGDSMLPIPSGSIIFAEYVQDWTTLRDQHTYIVVTVSEGIVFKRIYNRIPENNTLLLRSDNPAYQDFEVHIRDILEIWKFKAFLSSEPPAREDSVRQLTDMVMDLQRSVQVLREKTIRDD